MTRDPVCNAEVSEHDAIEHGWFRPHEGQTYYFCSGECLAQFMKNPQEYAIPTPAWEPTTTTDDYLE